MVNLQEITTRAEHAHHVITGFSLAMPALAELWLQVKEALSDTPALTTEISRLRDRLKACRINQANLAAAGRVALAAYDNGELDPLADLRDELLAQGFGADRGHA
jgi:hypothetical protein